MCHCRHKDLDDGAPPPAPPSDPPPPGPAFPGPPPPATPPPIQRWSRRQVARVARAIK